MMVKIRGLKFIKSTHFLRKFCYTYLLLSLHNSQILYQHHLSGASLARKLNAMKLVYQTADIESANKIIGVLKKAGIDSTLQGVHLFGLRTRRLGINPLTVWISNDAEEFRAYQVLETFHGSEAPPQESRPLSATRQLVLGVIVAGLALMFAIFSH